MFVENELNLNAARAKEARERLIRGWESKKKNTWKCRKWANFYLRGYDVTNKIIFQLY